MGYRSWRTEPQFSRRRCLTFVEDLYNVITNYLHNNVASVKIRTQNAESDVTSCGCGHRHQFFHAAKGIIEKRRRWRHISTINALWCPNVGELKRPNLVNACYCGVWDAPKTSTNSTNTNSSISMPRQQQPPDHRGEWAMNYSWILWVTRAIEATWILAPENGHVSHNTTLNVSMLL